MGKIKNIQGQTFGRLTVLSFDSFKNSQAAWLCQCTCGNKSVVVGGNLRAKVTFSCGCLKKEILQKTQEKRHGLSGKRPYRIWSKMKQRCNNSTDKDYSNYGKRGIKVSPSWSESFDVFWKEMKDGYSDNLTLDRIDNNDNYTFTNCRWSTHKEQGNNTRKNTKITYNGITKNLNQWSFILNIHRCVLSHRLKVGWDIEKAFETPVKKYKLKHDNI